MMAPNVLPMGKGPNPKLVALIDERMAALGIESDAELERLCEFGVGMVNNWRKPNGAWGPNGPNTLKLLAILKIPADEYERRTGIKKPVNHSLNGPTGQSESGGNAAPPDEGNPPMIDERLGLLEDMEDWSEERVRAARKLIKRLGAALSPAPEPSNPPKRRKA